MRMKQWRKKIVFLTALAALLSACGGGGGGGGGSNVRTDIGKYATDPTVVSKVASQYPWASGNTAKYIKYTVASPAKAELGPTIFDKATAKSIFNSDDVIIEISEQAQWDETDPSKLAFQNNISGDAGLVLKVIDDVDDSGSTAVFGRGDGEYYGFLILTGENTYTGDTTIESGALLVTNQLTGSKRITIKNSTGALIAIGISMDQMKLNADGGWNDYYMKNTKTVVIKGDVYNNGWVTVGGQGLELQGNLYNQSSNAWIHVDLDSYLHVTGVLDFNGGMFYADISDSWSKANVPSATWTTRTIIKADGGIQGWKPGNWDDTDAEYIDVQKVDRKIGSNYEMEATFRRKNTSFTLYSVLGYAPVAALNTGENLDRLFDTLAANPQQSALHQAASSIIATPAALLPQTWDSLSGEIYASLQNVTFKQSKVLNKTLSNRLYAIADPNSAEGTGVWFDGIGNKGKIYKEGWAEGKTELWGGQAGADYALTDKFILGGAVSASKATAKFNKYAGEAESTDVTISAYGTYNFGNNWYALGRAGIGFADVDVTRSIYVKPDWHPVKSSHKDTIYSAYAELGYKVNVTDNFRLTPFIGLSHDTVKRGSFEEKGHAFGLKGDKETFGQTAGVLGLRAQGDFGFFRLNGHVSHYAAFGKEDLSFKATLPADASGTLWDIKGVGLPRNTTWIGIGAEFDVTPAFTVNAGYDVSMERKKATDNVFTVGFRYKM
jgi:autotransporter-associated beta strand protein